MTCATTPVRFKRIVAILEKNKQANIELSKRWSNDSDISEEASDGLK